jgi:hypothetical protein
VVNGYLSANCLTDIFYIVSKNRDEAIAKVPLFVKTKFRTIYS